MSPPRIAVLVGELTGYALARVESDGRKPPRGVSWASIRAVALAILVVASVVATPVLAASTVAATPGESPSGMVGIPDANVQKDVPANHNGKTPTVSELRGSVMASAGAESLEVIISTRARACSQYLDSCSPSEVRGSEAGEFVLLLRDDVNAEGRRVAIPKDALKRTLGHVPSAVYGVHESGERWTAGVNESGGLAVFKVPHFSTNQVSFEGEVRVHGNYANGSTANYDLADLSSGSDPNVTLTGRIGSETDTVSAGGLGNSGSFALDVAGSKAATGASVTFTGTGFGERWDNYSATGVGVSNTTSIAVDGSHQPTDGAGGDPTVEVTGHVPYNDHNPAVQFSGGTNYARQVIGDTGGDAPYKADMQIRPDFTGPLTDITIDFNGINSGSAYAANVDVYIAPEAADGVYGEGTLVKDNWSPAWSVGEQTFALDTPYDVTNGTDYTVSFVTTNSDNDATADRLSIKISDTGFGWLNVNHHGKDYHPDITAISDPTLTGLSVKDDAGRSATLGNFTDGQTKTVTLNLQSDSTALNFSGNGEGWFDYTLTMQERDYTENPGIDVNGDGVDDASYTGKLTNGQTTTQSLPDLALTDDTGTVSLASPSAPVDASVTYTEHSETDSPKLTLNGNSSCVVSYAGVLGDGTTYNDTLPASCLVEGTNSLDVTMASVSADAPVPVVNVDYDHSAASKYDVAYSAEAWSERYNVSKTWASDRTTANLTIDFVGSVVTTRDIQVRENGGAWGAPAGTSWSGTTDVVDLGSIQSGDVTDVRVNGSKVRVNNGSIQVLNATNQGDALDTRFRVESWNADSYIDVSGTHEDAYTHYTDGESWSSPETYALIADGGNTQKVFLPKASAGSETRIRTVPAEFNPQQDVRVEVVEDDGSPRFRIEPGPVAGDDVTLVYHDTVSGETYELRSIEREMTIAKDTSQSPVYFEFSDDGDLVEIRLLSEDGGDGGTGGENPGGFVSIGSGGTDTTETIIILVVAAFVLLGAGILGRRRGVPAWAAGGVVATVFVVVVESVAPGAISGPIAETIAGFGGGLATVAPALWLFGGGVILWGAVRIIRKWTRKEEVVITGFRGGK